MANVSPIVQTALELRDAVSGLTFSAPVDAVYNPLQYAWEAHCDYLNRWGRGRRRVLLLGMNPGPWGMAQTGVPFGDVAMVRDWLGIRGTIRRPEMEHPRRPVLGWDCPRSEVSGARLWGWARERFDTPEAFFSRFFVHNYCPLCFMEASGRNFTPDKLRKVERQPLTRLCDIALQRIVETLQPEFCIGVGIFAETRLRAALPGFEGHFGRVPHPSPASPTANRGWAEAMDTALRNCGVSIP